MNKKTQILQFLEISIGMLLAGAGAMKLWMHYEMGSLKFTDFSLVGLIVFGLLISLGSQYVAFAKSKSATA